MPSNNVFHYSKIRARKRSAKKSIKTGKKNGIQLFLESGIHCVGIRNPVPGIRNPQHGIQNPRLSWIPLHGAIIIQLYAMAVQQESVSIIQMVSLPVSFLSLASASVVGDEIIRNEKGHFRFSVKNTVLLFVTHLFILSSRLFAVALFTVSYKWWVTSVLIFHCTVITICDIVWLCRGRGRNEWEQLWEVFKSFFYWFHRGYEMIFQYKQITSKKKTKRNI